MGTVMMEATAPMPMSVDLGAPSPSEPARARTGHAGGLGAAGDFGGDFAVRGLVVNGTLCGDHQVGFFKQVVEGFGVAVQHGA